MRNANLTGQQYMLPGLGHRAVSRRYYQNRAIHLRRAGDHVFYIVSMARAVHMRVMPRVCFIFHMRCVDGDPALFFFRRFVDLIILGRFCLPLQSHLSENQDEIAWVKELHPDCPQYWQAYAKYGCWGEHTIMAHCVYSDEAERAAIKEAGVWAVHCPDSNNNIASGIAPLRKMLEEGLNVALGSDIAGGAKLSMTDVATQAIRLSKLRWLESGKQEAFLTVREAFYLITTAGQAYFGAQPGFGVGEPLHAVVFNDGKFAYNPGLSLEERLERVLYLADKSTITAVYSAGGQAEL